MRIRPIQPDELPVFAGAATHSEHVGAVHDYVSDLLPKARCGRNGASLLKVVGKRLDVQPFGPCRK